MAKKKTTRTNRKPSQLQFGGNEPIITFDADRNVTCPGSATVKATDPVPLTWFIVNNSNTTVSVRIHRFRVQGGGTGPRPFAVKPHPRPIGVPGGTTGQVDSTVKGKKAIPKNQLGLWHYTYTVTYTFEGDKTKKDPDVIIEWPME